MRSKWPSLPPGKSCANDVCSFSLRLPLLRLPYQARRQVDGILLHSQWRCLFRSIARSVRSSNGKVHTLTNLGSSDFAHTQRPHSSVQKNVVYSYAPTLVVCRQKTCRSLHKTHACCTTFGSRYGNRYPFARKHKMQYIACILLACLITLHCKQWCGVEMSAPYHHVNVTMYVTRLPNFSYCAIRYT